jgi:hypothetical protein
MLNLSHAKKITVSATAANNNKNYEEGGLFLINTLGKSEIDMKQKQGVSESNIGRFG